MGTAAELKQTVREVRELGRRIVARQADVLDVTALRQAFDEGVAELGSVDIVLADAGIGAGGAVATEDREWDEVVGVNLKGVWNTGRVAIPSMLEHDRGGSIVVTNSTGGLMGVGIPTPQIPRLHRRRTRSHRTDAVVGELPGTASYPRQQRGLVRTPMAGDGNRQAIMEHAPDLARALSNAMPVDLVEPLDVSNAIAWLVSDDARYVTGTVLPVDAGQLNNR